MQNSIFSVGYIRHLMRKGDVIQYRLGNTEEEVLERISQIPEILNNASFSLSIDLPFLLKKDFLFNPLTFADKIYIRHLNKRLKRLYRIRHPQRHEIAKQISVLLKSDAPINIVRTDIKRFFRNVNFKSLIEKLRLDGYLSYSELYALGKIKETTLVYQNKGIPWGLSISSTLAEIYLQSFDIAIGAMHGCYFYQRFVDDIIIFTAASPTDAIDVIQRELENIDLNINIEKTKCIEETAANAFNFQYLGYDFKRLKIEKSKETQIEVSISDAKLKIIESRIKSSIYAFVDDQNCRDLRDRIRLLTGNYIIFKSSHEAPIKTGIYFNYSAVNQTDKIKDLDVLLGMKLKALMAHCKRRNQMLKMHKLREMLKYSFLEGFKNKITHRVSPSRLNELTSIW